MNIGNGSAESGLLESPRDLDFEYESSQEGVDDLNILETDFSELLIAPIDWTIGAIHNQIGNQIDLDPDFQRRNVWDETAKSRLIESLFLNIPVPQILLAANSSEKNKFLVIDGKQRLSTIQSFLSFDGFRLKNLRILRELNDMNWVEISQDTNKSQSFLNATLRTSVLRGWKKDSVLYEIFYRLNSGSVKLSPMELRLALTRGEFLKALIRWTEQPRNIHRLLRISGPDKRMADVELCVRFLGFNYFSRNYKGNLKVFLDDVTNSMNKRVAQDGFGGFTESALDEMEHAISFIFNEFLEREYCSLWTRDKFEGRFNRAIFDVQVSSLLNSQVQAWIRNNSGKFRDAFKDVCEIQDFRDAVTSTTKTNEAVFNRFSIWYKVLAEHSGLRLQVPNFEK